MDNAKVAYFTIDAMNAAVADKFRIDVLKDANGEVFSPTEKMVIFTATKASFTKNAENIILTAEESAQYSLDNIFGTWKPAEQTVQKEANNINLQNGKLTWSGDASMYLVEKDGQLVVMTADKELSLDNADGTFSVRAANEMGGFGPASSISTGIQNITTPSDAVSTTIYSVNGMQLSQPQQGVNIIVTTHADGTKTTHKVIRK